MSKIDQSVNSDTESEPSTNSSLENRTLRLISLTDVIRKEMEANDNLNNALTLKADIQSAVKELAEAYLKDQKFSETFIKRKDVQQYLQSPSVNIVEVGNDNDLDSNTSSDEVTNEIVVEVGRKCEDDGKYNKLDKRLTLVEHQLNKIYKILTADEPQKSEEDEQDTLNKELQDVKKEDYVTNKYDGMFYEWRENNMNRKFYKKSEETLKLNKKPAGTQFIPPPSIADMFPLSSQRQLNRPMFIKAVLRKDIKESRFMNNTL